VLDSTGPVIVKIIHILIKYFSYKISINFFDPDQWNSFSIQFFCSSIEIFEYRFWREDHVSKHMKINNTNEKNSKKLHFVAMLAIAWSFCERT